MTCSHLRLFALLHLPLIGIHCCAAATGHSSHHFLPMQQDDRARTVLRRRSHRPRAQHARSLSSSTGHPRMPTQATCSDAGPLHCEQAHTLPPSPPRTHQLSCTDPSSPMPTTPHLQSSHQIFAHEPYREISTPHHPYPLQTNQGLAVSAFCPGP